jgi:diaminopimelate decarboxylase
MNLFLKRQRTVYKPSDWGLELNDQGEVMVGGVPCTYLAQEYGTPLHVVDEAGLTHTAQSFIRTFSDTWPGMFSAHFAFKCNPVPGVIQIVKQQGFHAEVMSAFELALALRLGFQGQEIIANGPFKPDAFITACLEAKVRLIIADSIAELHRINHIAGQKEVTVPILLRINPDYVPKGMNSGSATGSRKGCALGLDLKGGEALSALELLPKLPHLHFIGLHFHIGSGIRDPEDYYHALLRLRPLVAACRDTHREIAIVDIGGGFAAPLSREMGNWEMLRYAATGSLPTAPNIPRFAGFEAFAAAVARGIRELFGTDVTPELIAEPGRSIASPNQILLLRAHQIKERPGVGQWVTTDGGIGTVTMPTYYEFHELFLCNDALRPRDRHLSINGPGCFAADQVYRNKFMPKILPDEVIAIMDSGAYFSSWESNFGFPRPAVVAARQGHTRVLRHRETFDQMMVRDVFEDQ